MALASMDDDVCRAARRILIIGVTGSGKSTHARAIEDRSGIPAIDVDAMAWRPGWVKTPDEELAAAAARVAAGEAWVMDSAWTAIRPVVLPRAELVVALDLPRWLSLARLLRRTATRALTREPVCGDNVESVRNVFSRDSILAWHVRSCRQTLPDARVGGRSGRATGPPPAHSGRGRPMAGWPSDQRMRPRERVETLGGSASAPRHLRMTA